MPLSALLSVPLPVPPVVLLCVLTALLLVVPKSLLMSVPISLRALRALPPGPPQVPLLAKRSMAGTLASRRQLWDHPFASCG